MATKQDLIHKIEATFDYIEGFAERNQDTIHSDHTRKIYIAQVLTLQDQTLVDKSYPFIVFNEGQPDEEAFWMSAGDPAPPDLQITFQAKMTAWLLSKLDAQIGTYIIRHIEGITADNAINRGTANIIVEDQDGNFLRKSAAVWEDAGGEWHFKEIQ